MGRLISSLCACALSLTAAAAPVKIVFDTDMIGDYDDVGAMAVLHKLADRGECEILATVSSTHSNASAGTVELLNSYYGRPRIPVGAVKRDGVGGGSEVRRSHAKYERLLDKYPGYWHHRNANDAPDATDVYRAVLAAQPDGAVTVCVVGHMTNLRKLLESKPDAHSPLDGSMLVAKKVKTCYIMGWRVPSGRECNAQGDVPSSKFVLAHWPTPIIIDDFAFSQYIYGGRKVAALPDNGNPVRDIFATCMPPAEKCPAAAEIIPTGRFKDNVKEGHNCFDQSCVLAAVRGQDSFFSLQKGWMEMPGDQGDNVWKPEPNGPHAIMIPRDGWPRERIATVIDDLMAEPRIELPGEADTRPALSPASFPDRMSAYVWRNWFVVPPDTLARVVGATPDQIAAMGAEMGLPANPSVLPEWKRKGYITVLRRNWHLLNYPQLLDLLGMTREELRFCLLEEDFLFVKLGNTKPKCDPLCYDAAAVAATAPARRRLAAVLKEEGIDAAAPEEPRFTFIHELSAPLPQSNNQTIKQSNNSSSPFDFRLIFSYFADYSDPLSDPDVASYPEGLLQRLSLQGVNAVWLHTALRTLAKDPKYPEFGEGSENRIANLKKLVARAGKYGIRVFLYMNEPRGLPADFFAARPERAALKGVNEGPRHAFCTSQPETLRWVRDSLTQVFASVPGLGGIFTITMSENLTHCASRWQKAKCPRCKDRSDAEIIAEINRTMIEGMVRGNPNAEALVWNWGWPKEEAQLKEIVAGLPKKNIRLMEVSENRMPFTRGGVACTVGDYSISVVGPGESAKGFWRLARGAGLPCVAKVQANCTWELCTFPYLPVTELVAEHASNLVREGVDGVMLSWSLGCCPAMNLRVFEAIRKGETTKEPVLDRLASELYGAAAAPTVRAAWHAFAEGFREYPFNIAVAYNGPQQWGPANPLYAEKTGWTASMVGFPYDSLDTWRGPYPADVWIQQFEKVAAGFAEGCAKFEAALAAMAPDVRTSAAKDLALFRAEQLHFRSVATQGRFILARDAKDVDAMKRLAREELDTAKALLEFARADSRIGYESSNHYYYTPQDIREKILSCRLVLKQARH